MMAPSEAFGSELARRRAQVGKDAVVVEADAIKNRDTVYRALTSLERDMDSLSDVESLSSYVHEYSTKAAEALLVAAGARLHMHCKPSHHVGGGSDDRHPALAVACRLPLKEHITSPVRRFMFQRVSAWLREANMQSSWPWA